MADNDLIAARRRGSLCRSVGEGSLGEWLGFILITTYHDEVLGHTTTVESIPRQDIKNHDKRVARVAHTLSF